MNRDLAAFVLGALEAVIRIRFLILFILIVIGIVISPFFIGLQSLDPKDLDPKVHAVHVQ